MQDNRNPHTVAARYEAFPPEEARRRDIHDTPKQGRRLNRAETAWSIRDRQGLRRRLTAPEVVGAEVGAGEDRRHMAKAAINWRFTVADAREAQAGLPAKPDLTEH